MPLEVPDRDEWFPKPDTFPRPDWPAIKEWIDASVRKEDLSEAYQQMARYWLARLLAVLGGTYTVAESDHFHFISALDEKGRTRMLQLLENARLRLLHTLGDVAWTDASGKHVVLRFTDVDNYYAYISHFYEDGEHASTGGVFLRKGYSHIAYFEQFQMDTERMILAHELAHNLLAQQPLPTWLNEALAEAFTADLAGGRFAALDGDLFDQHQSYWNAETIQEFWMGRSFQVVEGQRVAYSLAQVLLDVIRREVRPDPETFRRFIKQASWKDAGEAAALDHLEVGLGEIASVFLGDGDWSPKPATWEKHEEKA